VSLVVLHNRKSGLIMHNALVPTCLRSFVALAIRSPMCYNAGVGAMSPIEAERRSNVPSSESEPDTTMETSNLLHYGDNIATPPPTRVGEHDRRFEAAKTAWSISWPLPCDSQLGYLAVH